MSPLSQRFVAFPASPLFHRDDIDYILFWNRARHKTRHRYRHRKRMRLPVPDRSWEYHWPIEVCANSPALDRHRVFFRSPIFDI